MIDTEKFYDRLAPIYHLIYPDWERSIERQSKMILALIADRCLCVDTILDASCGIGTQAIGLAQNGFKVTASDLSPEAIRRAGREAAERGLSIEFSVADMRSAFSQHRTQFDLVISFDNSIPHLLTDVDIELTETFEFL